MTEIPRRYMSLDNYRGTARDILTINQPIADRFMNPVANMRRDVVVTNEIAGIHDYEQQGSELVAKRFRMPRFEDLFDSVVTTHKKDGLWVIGIDDRSLQDRIAEKRTDKNFDAKFQRTFESALVAGLAQCLVKEKLLNAQEINVALVFGYYFFVANQLPTIISGIETFARSLPVGVDPLDLGLGLTLFACAIGLSNVVPNVLFKIISRRHNEMTSGNASGFRVGVDIGKHDPFVRESVLGMLLPSVPVDRLVRGSTFLFVHQDEFIQK